MDMNQNPMNMNQNPMNMNQNPMDMNQNPMGMNLNPMGMNLNPMNMNQNPMNMNQNPLNMNQMFMNQMLMNQMLMNQMGMNQMNNNQAGMNQNQGNNNFGNSQAVPPNNTETISVTFMKFQHGYSNTVVKCCYSDKISDLIEEYRKKSGDYEMYEKFVFNAKNLCPDLTVAEQGLINGAKIKIIVTKDIKGAII